MPSTSVSSLITHHHVIFMFASFFPFFLYLLITAVIVINYGLECVTNLVIVYISYSAHILFDYKLMLVFFVFGGLNIHRCFTHHLNFQLVSE